MSIVKKDKNQLKDFIRINFINNVSSMPDFDFAEAQFLQPIVGTSLHEKLLELSATDAPAEPTAEQKRDMELLRRCRALVVPAAYLTELPLIHTQLTDTGLRTVSTDNMQAAHRWEYQDVKNYFVERIGVAKESLLRYLFLHKEHYAEWVESNEYKESNALLFKTGEDFNKYFPLHQPYLTYWELRPLIKEVEDFYVHSAIGEGFYSALKEKDPASDAEKRALELLKKAVAQTTIVKAVEKLSVRMTDKGFTLLMGAGHGDNKNAGDTPGTNTGLSLLYESCQRSGDAYLLQLQEYLNAKASAEVFKAYFESSYYKKPEETETESRNANRTSSFLF